VGRRTPDPLAHPERLTQSVYAYVAYRIGAGPDAEDVTSEAFARALRYRKSYDGSKGTPTAWLTGIARRVIAEWAAVNRPATHEIPEAASPGTFEEDALNKLTVERAVAMLGDRDRELVGLRYGADLTASQIGDLLDLSPNAVEVALHRALRRLRVALEAGADSPADRIPGISPAPETL